MIREVSIFMNDINVLLNKIKVAHENKEAFIPSEDDVRLLEMTVTALEEARFQCKHKYEYGYNMIEEKVNKVLQE